MDPNRVESNVPVTQFMIPSHCSAANSCVQSAVDLRVQNISNTALTENEEQISSNPTAEYGESYLVESNRFKNRYSNYDQ